MGPVSKESAEGIGVYSKAVWVGERDVCEERSKKLSTDLMRRELMGMNDELGRMIVVDVARITYDRQVDSTLLTSRHRIPSPIATDEFA